jgi:hypothetical protein
MRSFRGTGDHPASQLDGVSMQAVGKRTLTEAIGDAGAVAPRAAATVTSAAAAAPTEGRELPHAHRPTLENLFAPWCFYGRHRTFSGLSVGQVTFHGYLLRRPEAALLPNGPVDPGALLAEAEPLVTTIVDLEKR